jgi:hypothetical protein
MRAHLGVGSASCKVDGIAHVVTWVLEVGGIAEIVNWQVDDFRIVHPEHSEHLSIDFRPLDEQSNIANDSH